MLKIAILTGSTRPGRNNEAVAKWVLDQAKSRSDAEFEIVDIKDYNLPLLDEPVPPSLHQYTKDHTQKWAQKISQFDGFVIITPEYNHGTSAALKNALDFLYAEWNNKAVGFVSYGSVGGAARWRASVLWRESCRWPMCGPQSTFRSSPISRISAFSSRPLSRWIR